MGLSIEVRSHGLGKFGYYTSWHTSKDTAFTSEFSSALRSENELVPSKLQLSPHVPGIFDDLRVSPRALMFRSLVPDCA